MSLIKNRVFNDYIVGPVTATDNALVVYDTSTGELVKNGSLVITNDTHLNLPVGTTTKPPLNISSTSYDNIPTTILDGSLQNTDTTLRYIPNSITGLHNIEYKQYYAIQTQQTITQTLSNFFGSNTGIRLGADGFISLEMRLFFNKIGSGTVTFKLDWLHPQSGNWNHWSISPVGGLSITPNVNNLRFTTTGDTNNSTFTTQTLSGGGVEIHEVKLFFTGSFDATAFGSNELRIKASCSSGSMISQFGSWWEVNNLKQRGTTQGTNEPLRGVLVKDKDPFYDYVVLLLHCDGTNGQTTGITDSSKYNKTNVNGFGTGPHGISNTKTRWQSTTSEQSLNLANNAGIDIDYFSQINHPEYDITGDFTIESFVNITSFLPNESHFHIAVRGGASIDNDFSYYATIIRWDYLGSGPNPRLFMNFQQSADGTNFSATYFEQSQIYPVLGKWHHLAWCRKGNSLTMWFDGVLVNNYDTGGVNVMFQNSPRGFRMGAPSGSDIYIDEFRFTNGIARYTTAFTPPVYKLPDADMTQKMLLHFNNNFTDMYGHTMTASSAVLSSAQSVFGGYSALFNGTNNGLTTPNNNNDFLIRNNQFFFETRVRFVSLPASNGQMFLLNKGAFVTSDLSYQFLIEVDVNGTKYMRMSLSSNGTTSSCYDAYSSAIALSINTWYSFAFGRDSSNNILLFMNGTKLSLSYTYINSVWSGSLQTTTSLSCVDNTKNLCFGGFLNGYMDETRFVNGICRQTETYTIETTPFP